MELLNKVALITGGTHGIGAATALKLAEQGADISIAALEKDISESEINKKIKKIGRKCNLIPADISKSTDCKNVVDETVKLFGRVDILIHCAGGSSQGSLLEITNEHWYKAFDLHVHAIFHLCQKVVPFMKEKKEGSIVLISSAAGIRGVKGALTYAVVKGAMPQFARALALELSDFNIRVNCVAPGVIRTRFQDYLTPKQVKHNIENRIPLHKEGTPEEVAEVIIFLTKHNFLTGETISVDGGMSMRITI